MTLLEKYKGGAYSEVYAEIDGLGEKAFLPGNLPGIEAVLTETFERVAFNAGVIYNALKEMGYVFWDRPYHPPLPDTGGLLEKLNKTVGRFGYVPLSLQYFYRIVGGIDFTWNYKKESRILWNMADPLQVFSLDDILGIVDDEYWVDDISDYVNDENFGFAFLELAADDLHKDNVSGGPPYSLKITPHPSIDSELMNEPHQTSFIGYLRICFEHYGFPGDPKDKSFEEFTARVKPFLKPI